MGTKEDKIMDATNRALDSYKTMRESTSLVPDQTVAATLALTAAVYELMAHETRLMADLIDAIREIGR